MNMQEFIDEYNQIRIAMKDSSSDLNSINLREFRENIDRLIGLQKKIDPDVIGPELCKNLEKFIEVSRDFYVIHKAKERSFEGFLLLFAAKIGSFLGAIFNRSKQSR